ncbi:MAG: TolC family protein [Prevotellaceae bacterium]|nr:TolC family protein [Prevotellaceae bacterium]
MKHILCLLALFLACSSSRAQLTLERCKEMARGNYPVIKQLSLVEQSRNFSVSNAQKAYLPQLSLSGRAQYQSDATKLPVDLPSVSFKGLSRDQYDFSLNLSQSLYDGGAVSSQKALARRQGDVDYEQVNVALYDVYERVEEIFFGILSLDEQLRETALLQDDLSLSLDNVLAMQRSGVANQTDVDAVRVELAKARQSETGQRATREAYLRMLATFTGQEIAAGDTLVRPSLPSGIFPQENRRPELDLYNARSLLIDERLSALDTDLRPRLSLFAQGGYANPGLNIFKTGFQAYYQVGATLSWNFGSLYTRSNDKHKLEVERQSVDSEREAFLLNTSLQTEMQGGAIESLRKQIDEDDEIIALREGIREKADTKVENGTETVNEMLRDINAVSEARLTRSMHELQLLQEIQKLRTINNI